MALAQTCAWMGDADPESRRLSTSIASLSSLISHTPISVLKVTLANFRPAGRHPGFGQISTRCCGTVAAVVSGAPVEASQPPPYTT